MRRSLAAALAVAGGLAFHLPTVASASTGVRHLHFAAGPYVVAPGANQYVVDFRNVPKPAVNGFMIRAAQNIRYARRNGRCCAGVPRTDIVHLHHAVWLSNGRAGSGEGNGYVGFYPFMAVGEEKTTYELPSGYGYPVGARDDWILLRMLHNLTTRPRRVYITYDIDFIPDSSPAARGITPVHPIWMDVMDHHIYPVFDVTRPSGRYGRFTFPDMADNPYGGGPPLNEFTVDHPGTLVATAGHVHPGGLYTDLDLIRSGATLAQKVVPGSVPHSVRLFRSKAHYFDPRGPISWDLSMTATRSDWRPRVSAGDVLRVSTTYDSLHASWYEVMGIMVTWEAWDDQRGLDPFTGRTSAPRARLSGVDPFAQPIDERGHLTHGHLRENRHHGGTRWLTINLRKLPSCRARTVDITNFVYSRGDLNSRGSRRCIPTIKQGQSLSFVNEDASSLPAGIPGIAPSSAYLHSIFHTITGCRYPCTASTGISYPIANGPVSFSSGELGDGSPAIGSVSWKTPTNLPPGTYTYFCYVHPFMRGAFRIVR